MAPEAAEEQAVLCLCLLVVTLPGRYLVAECFDENFIVDLIAPFLQMHVRDTLGVGIEVM